MMQTVRNPARWPKAADAAPEPATQWANFDQDIYPSHCESGVAECLSMFRDRSNSRDGRAKWTRSGLLLELVLREKY